MTAILKVDTIQDVDGNNIINESSDTITIGAAGDTIDVPGTEVKTNKVSPTSGTSLQIGDSGDTVNVVGTLHNNGSALAGGITEADVWRINTSTSITAGMDITANWERCDTNFEKIGTGLTESSGVFTFPSTGKYLTCYDIQFNTTQNTNYAGIYLYLSTDGGSNFSHIVANTNTQIYASGGLSIGSASGCGIIDVTDASNFKFKLQVDYQNPGSGTPAIYAHTNRNRSYIYVIRLGDT